MNHLLLVIYLQQGTKRNIFIEHYSLKLVIGLGISYNFYGLLL